MAFMGKAKQLCIRQHYKDGRLPLWSFCWLEQLLYSTFIPNHFEKKPVTWAKMALEMRPQV